MLTVQCSQCGTSLKLQNAPASGQVKCPKCAAVVSVRGPGAQPPATQRPAAQRPAAPGNGAARPGARRVLTPDDDGFDFGSIALPATRVAPAVSQFPMRGNLAPYTGPIPGDPLQYVEQTADAHPAAAGGSAQPSAGNKPGRGKKLSGKALAGIGGTIAVLLAITIVVAVKLGGSGEGGGSQALGGAAVAETPAPAGYTNVKIYGCVIAMPAGTEREEVPSVIESKAVRSSGSESVYYLGAMDGGKLAIDAEQMRKKASKLLGGDILGGNPCERNGYTGIKGMLDGSLFLPRMQVEIYSVDERFVIIGCAPASMGADPSTPVDRGLEEKEQQVFFDSFKIGPKPSGWLF